MSETLKPSEQTELAGLSPVDYLKELTTPEGVRVIRNSKYSVLVLRPDPGSDWPSDYTSFMDIYAYHTETFEQFGYGEHIMIEENKSEIETASGGRDKEPIIPHDSYNVHGIALWVHEQVEAELIEVTKDLGRYKKGRITS